MATTSGKSRNRGKSVPQRERGKEELLEAARKRVDCERRAMKIVERLLEESISASFFEDCGKYITSKQFEDVAVERAIEKLCGYPMCGNKLTNIPKQQYHISLKSKKVFDITERKNFCSQRCFQAYKYYQTQLTDEPLWTRDYKHMPPIKLFEHDDNAAAEARLKPQNEVHLKQDIKVPAVKTISESTIDGASGEEIKLHSGIENLSLDKSHGDEKRMTAGGRREEMLRRIAESVARPVKGERQKTETGSGKHEENLHVAEKLASSCSNDREQEGVEHALTPGQHSSSTSRSELVETTSGSKVVSGHHMMHDGENLLKCEKHNSKDNLEDSNLQPGNHNSTLKIETNPSIVQQEMGSSKDKCHEKKRKKKKKTPVAENPMLVILQHIQQCILEWRSEETMKYIYGSSKSPSADQGDAGVAASNEQDLKSRDVVEFEKRVGDRLDREELEESAFSAPSKPLPDYNDLCREEEEKYALKVKEFFMGKEMTPSASKVEEKPTKPPDGPVDRTEALPPVDSRAQPPDGPVDRTEALPPVDSRAQVTIRRKILLERIGKILPSIAVSLQLSVHEVNPMITSLVRTFHPGSHNIVFKPVAWTVLTIVLIHILAEKEVQIKESLNCDQSLAFLTTMFNQMGLGVDDIYRIVQNFKKDGS